MATRGRNTRSTALSDSESDINLTGWDPYIVAITGGSDSAAAGEGEAASQSTDSRESRLMTWLREHGA